MARPTLVHALFAATFALLAGYLILDFVYLSPIPSFSSSSFKQQHPLHGASNPSPSLHGDDYLIGVGKADITGPTVEINFMGYASPDQLGTGLRQRLYSRTFILGSTRDPASRIVYLVLDTQSGDTAVRAGILAGIAALGPEYAALYGAANVAVTGTHSHAGPGAWLNYLLPQITSRGFDRQSYDAIVQGAVESVKRAHERLVEGTVAVGETELLDASVSRSEYAYLQNPKEERDRYEHNVDRTMTLMRFTRKSDGKHLGVLNWFAVHGTSMLGNNTLVAGDNKGVAAYLFEKSVKGEKNTAEGFVAGFSQANVGDTSPNIEGAWCEDGSGLRCRFNDSTCGGRNEPCHGRGPAFREKDQGAKSCFEIGRRQFEAAKDLYNSLSVTSQALTGSNVKSLHINTLLSNYTFTLPNGSTVRTCPAALGYSFAAGTTDGPGAFDFRQNTSGHSPAANPLWQVVRNLLHPPSPPQQACHAPKPILLDVGEVTQPYYWAPNIVDVQIFRVGYLVIIVSPSEATTMAGRRWREAVKARADELGFAEGRDEGVRVVLSGPANTYAHYVATREEYGVQRYEGASTLYGPYTLEAYIDAYTKALHYLAANATERPPLGPAPPVQTDVSLSFIQGVVFDAAPLLKDFGSVVNDVAGGYLIGAEEVARATFVGANPRNNLKLGSTYAQVEKRRGGEGDAVWDVVRDDADWSLVFEWKRTNTLLGSSEVTISWEIEDDALPGTYRLRYWGDSKAPISGEISSFGGISKEFLLET
ncbi:MAG: hypothetical protein M1814_005384 [Vezdaea aestivalis]|nr:MAG: hypothetical protein M1814_005384 [Vezdaea aestivalis]